MERKLHRERSVYDPKDLWQAAESSMPGVKVYNEQDVGLNPNLTVILCPLYAPGSLEESLLVSKSGTIYDSRVSGKFDAYQNVIKAMSTHLTEKGGSPRLTSIFANKGILHADEVTTSDLEALQNHSMLYQQRLAELSSELGIEHQHIDYDDIGVEFPDFVNPGQDVPVDLNIQERKEWKMIDALNRSLDLPHNIKNNKKMRHVVKGIMRMSGVGFKEAYWIIAGYMAADHKIADIVGDNGVYLVAERCGALFRISKLTPKLHNKVRVQIKA